MSHFQSELKYHIPFRGKTERKFGNNIFKLVWTGIYKANADTIAKNISMDGDISTRIVKIKDGWAIYTRYTWGK